MLILNFLIFKIYNDKILVSIHSFQSMNVFGKYNMEFIIEKNIIQYVFDLKTLSSH